MVDVGDAWPLFAQNRVGRFGEIFTTLKFRTIPHGAVALTTRGTFDPRASRWGQILRQSGADEVPQICNVLAGTMSLVGPRPMVMADIEYMQSVAPTIFDDWYGCYLTTKPGLIGPSQIYRHHFRDGVSPEIYRRSAELDLRYFDGASLAQDLGILAGAPLGLLRANIGVVDNT
jgi:lipopolysaccharide/colanic/teichoic acid biosynthesis glycosyltransferase